MTSIISTKPKVTKKTFQPSRKGKKAWRKNIDTTEIEKALEGIRDEERIIGGRIRDLPDEKIFTLDTLGVDNKKKLNKKFAKLKIDQILENKSKIPAILSSKKKKKDKNNKNSDDDDDTDDELIKRKNQIININDSEPIKEERNVKYDVWGENESEESSQDDDNDFLHPIKKRKIKPPSTIYMKPPDTIPAVHFPHPGASYNPKTEDHQTLLKIAHEEEVVKLQKKQKLQSQLPVPSNKSSSALIPEDMVYDGKSSEDEVEVKDDDDNKDKDNDTVKLAKNQRKKTKTERNREKRKFAKFREEDEKKSKKVFRKELEKLPEIIQNVESEFAERERQQAEKTKAAEEKANLPLKKIGKHPVKKLPIDVQLQEELSESLRTLKPEGNLFRERMASLEERNIIEPRVKVKRKRRYKLREFEKHSYKN